MLNYVTTKNKTSKDKRKKTDRYPIMNKGAIGNGEESNHCGITRKIENDKKISRKEL
jgi:hypothetical protein